MNKKLMAVAVAGALSVPAVAFAQSSTVQIQGQVKTDLSFVNAGRGRANFDQLDRYDSEISFKGTEALGGGLNAWFQINSTFGVEGSTGVTAGSNGLWADRNTGIGLNGNFGNFFYGHWDAAYKLSSGASYRPFSTVTTYGVSSILHNGQTGSTDNITNVTAFHRRQGQSLNYHSPVFSGFQIFLSASTTSELTGSASTVLKPRMYSFGAVYNNGPIYIGAGHERHNDYNPGAAPLPLAGVAPVAGQYGGGRDTAWNINGAYTFGGVFKLGAIYERLSYDVTLGTNLDAKAWGVFGDWNIAGPHWLKMEYVRGNGTSGNAALNVGNLTAPTAANQAAGTGGNLWGIKYAYQLSKRTLVSTGYAQLSVDAASRYQLANGVARNAPGLALGGSDKQSGWTLGIEHTF